MFSKSTKYLLITALGLLIAQTQVAMAGNSDNDDKAVNLRTRKLNGPRLGLTYVAQSNFMDRNGKLNETLKENDIGVLISQFGWHFEWLVTPDGGGPSFVTQLVPFIGGVEYATVIPSTTVVLGIRMPKGFEFGMGPNVLFRIKGDNPISTSLLLAIGQSINFNGVSIPLNLGLLTNNEGTRFSFVFGYALGSNVKWKR